MQAGGGLIEQKEAAPLAAGLVEPLAIVRDADHDPAALVVSLEADGSERGLALGDAFVGHFNAVVRRVADHVDERVRELLDDVAVQLRVLARQEQLDLFALRSRKIADQARHFLECGTDRHHAQGHRVVLEIGGDARELAHAARELPVAEFHHLRMLDDHGLRDHKFANQVHQGVEFECVDLNEIRWTLARGWTRRLGLGGLGRVGSRGLSWRRGGSWSWRRGGVLRRRGRGDRLRLRLGGCGSGFRRCWSWCRSRWRLRNRWSRLRRGRGLRNGCGLRLGGGLGLRCRGCRRGCRRLGFPMQACVAPSDDAQGRNADGFTGVCSRETFTDFFNELPERVTAGQNDVDHRRRDREFAAPCGV